MVKLSVVIAAYNEEKNIIRCLKSVGDIAFEIILVDASSQDKTVELARKYTDKIFIINNNKMFHKNKQFGLQKATGSWILQLDADEELSGQLRNEILEVINNEKYDAYSIPRNNYFLGRLMHKGGLYPDAVIRLFKKDRGVFPCISVHEQIQITGNVSLLINALNHYPYPTITEYILKADRYTGLTADELFKNTKVNYRSFVKYCIVLPVITFFSIFIRHQGISDGIYGFIWAFLSSTHYPFAYTKLLSLSKMK